jgi:hypothetical protein
MLVNILHSANSSTQTISKNNYENDDDEEDAEVGEDDDDYDIYLHIESSRRLIWLVSNTFLA